MPRTQRLSRRTALKIGAGGMALPLVHIRTVGAAGNLTVAFDDHPVPGAGAVMRKLVEGWAAKTKTDVQLQLFDPFGTRSNLVVAEEAQAGTGHDILTFLNYEVDTNADKLEPMDDVIQRLSGRYGKLDKVSEYLANIEGSYRAVPTYWLYNLYPCCTRIDFFKQYVDMNVQAVFPVSGPMVRATITGPGMLSWWLPRNVPGRAIRSALRSATAQTHTTGSARCSRVSAPSWWTPKATSPSDRTRCARRSTTGNALRHFCSMSMAGTTPPTTRH
jgi:hypothetical protein